MGLFSKLFGKKQTATTFEFSEAVAFNREFEALLSADKFIARSDYKHLIEKYGGIYTFFQNANKANTLSYYCKMNKLQETEIRKFLAFYEDSADLKKGSTPIFRSTKISGQPFSLTRTIRLSLRAPAREKRRR